MKTNERKKIEMNLKHWSVEEVGVGTRGVNQELIKLHFHECVVRLA
jgi:hypothetical protein